MVKQLTTMQAAFKDAGVQDVPESRPKIRRLPHKIRRAVFGTHPDAYIRVQEIEHQADMMALVLAMAWGKVDERAAIEAAGSKLALSEACKAALNRAADLVGGSSE